MLDQFYQCILEMVSSFISLNLLPTHCMVKVNKMRRFDNIHYKVFYQYC